MSAAPRLRAVITTPTFEASARRLLDEADRRRLELTLAEQPLAGAVIPRTGAFRKLRFRRPSRAEDKRGGVRIVYYYVDRRERVYLVLAYAKNRKDDLTAAEEDELREVARVLDGER